MKKPDPREARRRDDGERCLLHYRPGHATVRHGHRHGRLTIRP
ncbi:hypothetical protein BN2364_2112 [Alloalcanivorax xenomutans]|nr:hypothetical protein BN2364_2112 [Alloalcanivorax xenomutans]